MSCKNKGNCKKKECKNKKCDKPSSSIKGSTPPSTQNGKGDSPRNMGPQFFLHYDQIDWSGAKYKISKKKS